MFILAHEIGHHINGHSLDILLYVNDIIDTKSLNEKRSQELEADEFAGFVLAKLGATMNETSKVLSNIPQITNERSSTHPSRNKRILSVEIGFEKGKRTTDHILTLNTIMDQSKFAGQTLYTCFIDLKQAYDRINRKYLLYKMAKYKFRTKFLTIIQSMNDNIAYNVLSDGAMTSTFTSRTGLKQGDPTSPKFFNMFINDIFALFTEGCSPPKLQDMFIPILSFADDMILLSTTPQGLQEQINRVQEYCNKWGLTINRNKTQVMTIHRQEGETLHTFKIENDTLQNVEAYQYLGIELTHKGDIHTAKDSLYLKAQSSMFAVLKTARKLPVKVAMNLLEKLVDPILTYGIEAWLPQSKTNFKETTPLEQIYDDASTNNILGEKLRLKYTKAILGVNKYATNAAVRGETGLYPLYTKAIPRTLKYLERLESETGTKSLLPRVYEAQKIMMSNNKNCWLRCITRIRNKCAAETGEQRDYYKKNTQREVRYKMV